MSENKFYSQGQSVYRVAWAGRSYQIVEGEVVVHQPPLMKTRNTFGYDFMLLRNKETGKQGKVVPTEYYGTYKEAIIQEREFLKDNIETWTNRLNKLNELDNEQNPKIDLVTIY